MYRELECYLTQIEHYTKQTGGVDVSMMSTVITPVQDDICYEEIVKMEELGYKLFDRSVPKEGGQHDYWFVYEYPAGRDLIIVSSMDVSRDDTSEAAWDTQVFLTVCKMGEKLGWFSEIE